MVPKNFLWLAMPLALIGGCSSEKAPEPAAKAALTLQEFMTQKIDVHADAIWAIGNAAIDDTASIDPAKMDEKGWTGIAQAAERMAVDARALAALDPVVVTRPGVKIADEGTAGAPSPADIQGHIARDHDTFRALAGTLATHADGLAGAARARDAATVGRLVNEMDGVCESCHLEYWYPEQKALVKQIEAAAPVAAPSR